MTGERLASLVTSCGLGMLARCGGGGGGQTMGGTVGWDLDERVSKLPRWRRVVGELGVGEVTEGGQNLKTKIHPSHPEIISLKLFRWIA